MKKEYKYPKISIISIIYDIAPFLPKCLLSLGRQTYPNLEIILVVGRAPKDAEARRLSGTGRNGGHREGEGTSGQAEAHSLSAMDWSEKGNEDIAPISATEYKRLSGPDRCLYLARIFAARHDNVKIVTCTASGAGDARNRGLDAATGDYIGFVDGDDWVEPDMFQRLYENLVNYGASISVCGKFNEYPGESVADFPRYIRPNKDNSGQKKEGIKDVAGKENPGIEEGGNSAFSPSGPSSDGGCGSLDLRDDSLSPELMDPEAAFRMILLGSGFFFHSWDKLFPSDLFQDVRFPSDRYLEDRYVIWRLLEKAGRIVYDRTPLYHFRIRSDSLSRIGEMAELNTAADEAFCQYLEKNYPGLKREAAAYLLYDHITCIQNKLVQGKRKDECETHIDYVRHHIRLERNNPYMGRNTRIKAFLALHFLPGLKWLTKWNQRKAGKAHEKYSISE